MNDRDLAAEARRAGAGMRRRTGDLDRLAGVLLARLADRLDELAAAQPAVVAVAWCKGCEHGTASVPCPACDGPACAGCGRCPPCDGPVPGGGR